ncbi:MAG: A/G-specific adenine glycosylase [Patescibacteria group bacterium]
MRLSRLRVEQFQTLVWHYYKKHGRKFPWRKTRDPYAILVSEIMLQQTQVERVIPKYLAWMKKFPTIEALARAPLKEALLGWQGLGYNRRALNLKRAAEIIVSEHDGEIPRDLKKLDTLSGVGPYTAAAVMAFAWNEPVAFVETNIRTVFLHHFFPRRKEVRDGEILRMVEQTLPANAQLRSDLSPDPRSNLGGVNDHPSGPLLRKEGRIRAWYSALMDYGAHLKETIGNPNARSAQYAKQSKFRGSRRELRGEILRKAATQKFVSRKDVISKGLPIAHIFMELVREGFLKKEGSRFTLT